MVRPVRAAAVVASKRIAELAQAGRKRKRADAAVEDTGGVVGSGGPAGGPVGGGPEFPVGGAGARPGISVGVSVRGAGCEVRDASEGPVGGAGSVHRGVVGEGVRRLVPAASRARHSTGHRFTWSRRTSGSGRASDSGRSRGPGRSTSPVLCGWSVLGRRPGLAGSNVAGGDYDGPISGSTPTPVVANRRAEAEDDDEEEEGVERRRRKRQMRAWRLYEARAKYWCEKWLAGQVEEEQGDVQRAEEDQREAERLRAAVKLKRQSIRDHFEEELRLLIMSNPNLPIRASLEIVHHHRDDQIAAVRDDDDDIVWWVEQAQDREERPRPRPAAV